VDIEPESSICRSGRFVRCQFLGNRNFGLLAPAGDGADITFEQCSFRAPAASARSATPRAVWPDQARMSFRECHFDGSVVNTFGSPDPAAACRFVDCQFAARGDPAYGTPYTGIALVDATGQNVRLDGCVISASTSRSILLDKGILEGSRVVHGFTGLAPGDYQASVARSRVAGTTFEERHLTSDYYIAAEGATVQSGVVVDGPRVAWARVGGPTGRIAPA
jgi:hypothetical protein